MTCPRVTLLGGSRAKIQTQVSLSIEVPFQFPGKYQLFAYVGFFSCMAAPLSETFSLAPNFFPGGPSMSCRLQFKHCPLGSSSVPPPDSPLNSPHLLVLLSSNCSLHHKSQSLINFLFASCFLYLDKDFSFKELTFTWRRKTPNSETNRYPG